MKNVGIISDYDELSEFLVLILKELGYKAKILTEPIFKKKCDFVSVFSNNIALYKELNVVLLEKNIPWISCRTLEKYIEIGPLVIPHKTLCINCYFKRRFSHIGKESDNIYKRETTIPPCVRFLLCGIVASEIYKYFNSTPSTLERILLINSDTLEIKRYRVYKIPWCNVCGEQNEYF